MNKNTIPEDFTLSLALVDAIPVIVFGLNCFLLGKKCNSLLFIIGAIVCTLAGLGKAIWKIIVALKKKNIWFLFVQMRIFMPIGFLMMVIGCVCTPNVVSRAIQGFMQFPSILFYCLGIFGMCMMGYCAKKLDNTDLKSNWIEQSINGISQICFLIGILL